MAAWMIARLIGGPANGRIVRIPVDGRNTEIYRILVRLVSKDVDLGWLIAKYRDSRLSETELDGSIPIMLYGFVRLENE